MRGFVAALRFLTVLPLAGSYGAGEKDLAASPAYFPLVGLLLGAAAAGAACALSLAAAPMLTAALLVGLLLAFSGALHMDGLSDTADGFLSSRPRERVLEIMKDSHVGAMGVIAIVLVLLVKFAALATVAGHDVPVLLWPAVLLMPLAGRCVMVLHMALLPGARAGGLGAAFLKRRPWAAAAWSMAVLAAACAALFGAAGLAIAGAVLAVTLLQAGWSWRKIGGSTGDTFGAACEVAELVPVVMLALWPLSPARWL